ncbi:universal stress protein [Nitrobacter sp.]|jgi:nucleotide-binding universal stress UspA family protein|uniref:universal stress protein n=1 Tax=Nitrobacter sp. TaxID=29420 RepID=UPI003F64CBFC
MTYATIMVSLASDQANERCLAIARETVERFDARAIGIAAAEFSPPLYFTSGEQADKMIEQGRNAIRMRLSELEAEFREAMGPGAKHVEWRSNMETPTRFIAREARTADIIVIGQSRDGAFTDPFARANPSDLVMQAGRPILVVPEAAGWLDLRSVLVAWKDTPEARRAIVDALPLLRKAKDVTIAEIVENGGSREAALNRTQDVVTWLSYHDIAASALVQEESSTRDAATALDGIASSVGAGVLVAGAYGHSRLREWVLGGVTQHLATESTRCVLLSR